jgi:hypothetical protein
MPYKFVHLTEKWDETYRNQSHPDIQKSVLHHLSSVVGKASIAPRELAKQYLTDGNLKNQLSLFTFNKEELIKLRKDILENPEKYEKMLS